MRYQDVIAYKERIDAERSTALEAHRRPSADTRSLEVFRPQVRPLLEHVVHPDDFIFDLLDLHPARVCEAVANHRRSLKNPPKTADEYLDTLLKQALTQTVGVLRDWKAAF